MLGKGVMKKLTFVFKKLSMGVFNSAVDHDTFLFFNHHFYYFDEAISPYK